MTISLVDWFNAALTERSSLDLPDVDVAVDIDVAVWRPDSRDRESFLGILMWHELDGKYPPTGELEPATPYTGVNACLSTLGVSESAAM